MKKVIYPILAILWEIKEWLKESVITCILITLILIFVLGAIGGFETGFIEDLFLSFGGEVR